MGLELELSELAVIRTAVDSEGGVKPTRPGGGEAEGEDNADTGCVTPRAAVSPMPRRSSGVDFDAGCVTPKAVVSVPLRGDDVEDGNTGCATPMATTTPTTPRLAVLDACCFVTPTSAASVLPPPTECPPAPRKPARRSPVAAKRKRRDGRPALQRCFFPVPRDLTKVFVARAPPADSSPPRDAANKKIRVLPVG
jgi:hypothetical protein